jgi:hypothetical protein
VSNQPLAVALRVRSSASGMLLHQGQGIALLERLRGEGRGEFREGSSPPPRTSASPLGPPHRRRSGPALCPPEGERRGSARPEGSLRVPLWPSARNPGPESGPPDRPEGPQTYVLYGQWERAVQDASTVMSAAPANALVIFPPSTEVSDSDLNHIPEAARASHLDFSVKEGHCFLVPPKHRPMLHPLTLRMGTW